MGSTAFARHIANALEPARVHHSRKRGTKVQLETPGLFSTLKRKKISKVD